MNCPNSNSKASKKENFSTFFHSDSKGVDDVYPHWWGQSILIATKWNANLIWKHSYSYTQK